MPKTVDEERFYYRRLRQLPDETIEDFAERLKLQIAKCNYSATESEERLKEQLIDSCLNRKLATISLQLQLSFKDIIAIGKILQADKGDVENIESNASKKRKVTFSNVDTVYNIGASGSGLKAVKSEVKTEVKTEAENSGAVKKLLKPVASSSSGLNLVKTPIANPPVLKQNCQAIGMNVGIERKNEENLRLRALKNSQTVRQTVENINAVTAAFENGGASTSRQSNPDGFIIPQPVPPIRQFSSSMLLNLEIGTVQMNVFVSRTRSFNIMTKKMFRQLQLKHFKYYTLDKVEYKIGTMKICGNLTTFIKQNGLKEVITFFLLADDNLWAMLSGKTAAVLKLIPGKTRRLQ